MTNEATHTLFTPSGCLNMESMKRYRDGSLSAEEKALVEKHLVSCELCTDAMEGYELMSDPDKLDAVVTEINTNLRANLRKGKGKVVPMRSGWLYAGIAASVVILFGILFWLNENKYAGKLNQPLVDMIDLSTYQSVPEKPLPAGQDRKTSEPMKKGKQTIQPQENEITIARDEAHAEEDVAEFQPTESLRQPALSTLKALKSDDSSIQAFAMPSPAEDDKMQESLDIASAQPLEFYIGEVVVYNDDVAGLDADGDAGSNIKGITTMSQSKARSSKSGSTSKQAFNEPALVTEESAAGITDSPAEVETDSARVNKHFFATVESMPEFPGGRNALSEYFDKTLNYPNQARKQGIQGTVYLSFIIQPDGAVTDATVIQGIGGGCDKEALRAVQSMPDWKPARQNNVNVPVLITIPVSFRLR